ncbi:MAG TPA: DUF1289 domain-containing protein [Accumulibacter sp.]|nr:DUF1289 domain-containing protein [Accumulibacter sp.]HQC81414.1 DUF1289 domain-containing protein [Accumulibacter sp.]
MDTEAVASPCINICRMDAHSGLCGGCFRTLAEIAAWSGATNDRRLRILQAVERRRADHDPLGGALGGELRGDCER